MGTSRTDGAPEIALVEECVDESEYVRMGAMVGDQSGFVRGGNRIVVAIEMVKSLEKGELEATLPGILTEHQKVRTNLYSECTVSWLLIA